MQEIRFHAVSVLKQVRHKPDNLRVTTAVGHVTKTFTVPTKISEKEIKRRCNDTRQIHEFHLASSIESETVRLTSDGPGFLFEVMTKGGQTEGRQKQHYLLLKRNAVYRINTTRLNEHVVSVDLVNSQGEMLNLWNPHTPLQPASEPPDLWQKAPTLNFDLDESLVMSQNAFSLTDLQSGPFLEVIQRYISDMSGQAFDPTQYGCLPLEVSGPLLQAASYLQQGNEKSRVDGGEPLQDTAAGAVSDGKDHSSDESGSSSEEDSVDTRKPSAKEIATSTLDLLALNPEEFPTNLGLAARTWSTASEVSTASSNPFYSAKSTISEPEVTKRKKARVNMVPKHWEITAETRPFHVTIASSEDWGGAVEIKFGGIILPPEEVYISKNCAVILIPAPPPLAMCAQRPATCVEVDVEVRVAGNVAYFTHFTYRFGSNKVPDESEEDDDDDRARRSSKRSKHTGPVRMYTAVSLTSPFQGKLNCSWLQRGFSSLLQAFLDPQEAQKGSSDQLGAGVSVESSALVRCALLDACRSAIVSDSLDKVDAAGFTLLHYVSALGLSNLAHVLVEKGANPNAIGLQIPHTPLGLALSHSASWAHVDCQPEDFLSFGVRPYKMPAVAAAPTEATGESAPNDVIAPLAADDHVVSKSEIIPNSEIANEEIIVPHTQMAPCTQTASAPAASPTASQSSSVPGTKKSSKSQQQGNGGVLKLSRSLSVSSLPQDASKQDGAVKLSRSSSVSSLDGPKEAATLQQLKDELHLALQAQITRKPSRPSRSRSQPQPAPGISGLEMLAQVSLNNRQRGSNNHAGARSRAENGKSGRSSDATAQEIASWLAKHMSKQESSGSVNRTDDSNSDKATQDGNGKTAGDTSRDLLILILKQNGALTLEQIQESVRPRPRTREPEDAAAIPSSSSSSVSVAAEGLRVDASATTIAERLSKRKMISLEPMPKMRRRAAKKEKVEEENSLGAVQPLKVEEEDALIDDVAQSFQELKQDDEPEENENLGTQAVLHAMAGDPDVTQQLFAGSVVRGDSLLDQLLPVDLAKSDGNDVIRPEVPGHPFQALLPFFLSPFAKQLNGTGLESESPVSGPAGRRKEARPRCFAVLVGSSSFAEEIKTGVRQKLAQFGFPAITTLTNQEATRKMLKQTLTRLAAQTADTRDRVLVYIAGQSSELGVPLVDGIFPCSELANLLYSLQTPNVCLVLDPPDVSSLAKD